MTQTQVRTQNPVGWFEIPVKDMKRAKTFYEKTLDVSLEAPKDMEGFEMSFFPMSREGQGAAGALIRGHGYKPSHDGTLVYFSVADIETTEAIISANGGKVLKPKRSIGQYGFISIDEDSEGNRIALHSMS